MYQQYIPKWHLLERHYQKIFLTGLPIPPLTKKEIKPYKDSEDHWKYEKKWRKMSILGVDKKSYRDRSTCFPKAKELICQIERELSNINP